jgi:hypothetical protein
VIVLLALSCALTMIKLRWLERSGGLSRRAMQRQQRLHWLALVLCAAMLLLLPLLDAPIPPLRATASDVQ